MSWDSTTRRRNTRKWSPRLSSASRRGEYLPGSLLPSEHQLVERFRGLPADDRQVAVGAAPGRLDRHPARPGRFVRGRPALAGAERTRPAGDALELPETELSGELVQAGGQDRAPLRDHTAGPGAGAKAFLRQRCSADDGEPVELASVWLPLDLAAGTDLASPDLLNESIRHHLARPQARSGSTTRSSGSPPAHPTGEESALLQLSADAPVLGVIVAVYDATKTPAPGRGPRPAG